MTNKPELMLWLSDARGVYIPRDFALSFKDRAKSVAGVSDEDWAILEHGPDDDSHSGVNEWYWETWAGVEANAIVTDDNGHKYRVYQDADCWLVPVGMEFNESGEGDMFVWPETISY